MSWFRHLRSRWEAWTGDREMELSIRRHLNENGYFGNGAKITGVRLCAVQRPGWVQVYRFDVSAKRRVDEDAIDSIAESEVHVDDGDRRDELFGLIKDDARGKVTRIRVFTDAELRRELFEDWADGLLRTSRGL